MSTSSVPRATMRPRERVDVLPSSSVASTSQQMQHGLRVQNQEGGEGSESRDGDTS